MPDQDHAFNRSEMTLFTDLGERKYLSSVERGRVYDAIQDITNPIDQTFCETIYWTGCRPCEALNIRFLNIEMDLGCIIVRSAKKRGDKKNRVFRAVPVPSSFIDKLEQVHNIHRIQYFDDMRLNDRLWRFSRTTGWRRMAGVMNKAGLSGVKACSRGLRHSMGVHAASNFVPESRIQKWLGHESLDTTAIYMDMAGLEDRAIAKRMWAA